MISCFSDAVTYVSLCRPHGRFGDLARSRFSYAQCNNQDTVPDFKSRASCVRSREEGRRHFMTGKKGWGSTVAGWFIEREEGAGQEPAAEMSAEEAQALINEAGGVASSPEAYATPS